MDTSMHTISGQPNQLTHQDGTKEGESPENISKNFNNENARKVTEVAEKNIPRKPMLVVGATTSDRNFYNSLFEPQ